MTKKLIIAMFGLMIAQSLFGQSLTPQQYVEMYKDIAIHEMKRMGVPADITLAQGILESESGNSELVKKSNNHFGIKCKNSWSGGGVNHDDDELQECFRAYKTAEESYRDHSNFLRNNPRYANLFKLDVTDYEAWAYGLKKAGYATNPQYPQRLIKLIAEYNLHQYTTGNAADVVKYDATLFEDDKEVLAEVKKQDQENLDAIDLSSQVVKINGIKCCLVNKGTSLLAIAQKHDVHIAKLLEYNETLTDGLLPVEQYVYLQPKAKEGSTEYYIADGGETLLDVSNKTGVQLASLQEYNKIDATKKITKGTKISLYVKLPMVQSSKAKNIHTVQSKEGLYSIAKKYNITVEQIKEWNKLESEALRIGQELIIAQ